MNNYIDIYCERVAPGLWAEPVNALTNLSFFIAAFFVWRLAQQENAADAKSMTLAFFLLLIGTGSALFHTFASGWAQMSDVLPILMYQIAFIWFYALDVMKAGAMRSALLFALFMGGTVVAEQLPRELLNGSLSYAPAFLFLSGFALWHMQSVKAARYVLVWASLVFLVSLTFRSVDMAVCKALPMGTHFLWHVLNGLVLYLTARGYILAKAQQKI